MNLNAFLRWALRQALGKRRGQAAIDLLTGPVGGLIDMAAGGRVSAALTQIETATAPLASVLRAAGEA